MKVCIPFKDTFVLSLTDERETASGFGYKRTLKPALHQQLIKQFFDRLIYFLLKQAQVNSTCAITV